MGLTDAEIIELEGLLAQEEAYQMREVLRNYDDNTSPNYKYLRECLDDPDINGAILEGSSRSSKTWSGVDFIIWLCTEVETNCKINIYREFFADFKDTLYDDFKRRLDDFGLDNPFHTAQIVRSFKIGQNTISFKGCDKVGSKHGAGADYVFYNEMMHVPRAIFDQSEMRCRKFWWGDYNPSFTDHWVFNSVLTRDDVGFIRTTFLDNAYISEAERRKILSYEPWEPGSYEIIDDQVCYNGEPVDEKNQPPAHHHNIEQGTADEFMWKVYGLGLRGAMKGQIFPLVTWINEFPDLAFTFGLDFGWTNDPTALVRYAREGRSIYMELLIYQPIQTPNELDAALHAVGVSKYVPITADSADRYVSDTKGSFQMVRDLFDRGWEIAKVSKTKSVMYWLSEMKGYKIHIVKNRLWKFMKREQENYKFKEVNGILINQPIDGWDHGFSAGRYAHMSHGAQNFGVDIR